MNTKASVLSKTMAIVAPLLAVAAVVVRILLMSTYDGIAGFYTNDTLHRLFTYPLTAFAIISFVLPYIYIKEGKIPFSFPENKGTSIVSMICACVFGGYIIFTFAKFVIPTLAASTKAEIIMAIFCVMALFFFLSGKSKLGDVRALLCSGSALVMLALVFGLYFNPEISYVNHSVVLCYAAAIFLMLATMAEANSTLSRPALRRYICYAPTAVVLAFALSIPDIIYAVTNTSAPLTNIYYDFIFLALGVYHGVKLISIARVKPQEEPKNNDKEDKDEKAAGN